MKVEFDIDISGLVIKEFQEDQRCLIADIRQLIKEYAANS
jgi:hypothetical protein